MAYTVQREAAYGGGWVDVFEAQKEADAERWRDGLLRTCGRSHLRIIKK